MSKPILNRKSAWRTRRLSVIRSARRMMKHSASNMHALRDSNAPMVLVKMQEIRYLHWLRVLSDAICDTQTPRAKTPSVIDVIKRAESEESKP